MFWLWLIFAGLFGGITGGMGMGGGTLLIPVLTIFLGVNQHLAQGINLLVFIPMGIVAIIIHCKNRLIKFNSVIFVILAALVSASLSAYSVRFISANNLKICFAVFLLCLGSALLIYIILKHFRQKNENKINTKTN